MAGTKESNHNGDTIDRGPDRKTLCVSPRTVWTLTQEGAQTCVRIGRRVLYAPDDVRASENLLECSGAQRDLRTIDETAAEDFKLFLLKANLASTTVAKRLQFARQFFKAAVKRKLISSNPFADVGAKATMKDDRERFVTREETDRLLAACPNIDWRVIVGLCRFGGLRCPSETT